MVVKKLWWTTADIVDERLKWSSEDTFIIRESNERWLSSEAAQTYATCLSPIWDEWDNVSEPIKLEFTQFLLDNGEELEAHNAIESAGFFWEAEESSYYWRALFVARVLRGE